MIQYFSAILKCNKKGFYRIKRERKSVGNEQQQQKKELNNKKKCTKTFNNSEKCTLKIIINVLAFFFFYVLY